MLSIINMVGYDALILLNHRSQFNITDFLRIIANDHMVLKI